MKIRIKRHGVDIWRKVDSGHKLLPEGGYIVSTIFFNPIDWLKSFIWIQIDVAFRRYGKFNNK